MITGAGISGAQSTRREGNDVANSEHLALLKQSRTAWDAWRAKNPSVLPDLSGTDLSHTDLSGADLISVDLSGANLCGAELDHAALGGANLARADLRDASLGNAGLGVANLGGADLRGTNLFCAQFFAANLGESALGDADLSSAYLFGANLDGADLEGANLFRANLTNASLRGTKLGAAHLQETVFANVDLTDAKGLGDCHHHGPSVIDHRTLRHSRDVPLSFWRGCGLSDWEIEAAKLYRSDLRRAEITDIAGKLVDLRCDNPIQYSSCFISYCCTDRSLAQRLHDHLQERGVRCWLDEHQVLPGDEIYERFAQGSRRWDKVLLCCSRASLNSWWVDNEINAAFEKERQFMKERGAKAQLLMPLNLDGYLFSDEWQQGNDRQLQSRIAADFAGWEEDNAKFEAEFQRLVKALRTDDLAREQTAQPKA